MLACPGLMMMIKKNLFSVFTFTNVNSIQFKDALFHQFLSQKTFKMSNENIVLHKIRHTIKLEAHH